MPKDEKPIEQEAGEAGTWQTDAELDKEREAEAKKPPRRTERKEEKE